MKPRINANQIKKNIAISIFAQAISLGVSFVMNLILPKYISEYQYAYWQTYLLYVGYVGIFHFGLLDGIVLRYSQYDYDELDFPTIRSQFRFMLFGTGVITLLMTLCAWTYAEAEMRGIFIMVAMGVITRNLFTYTSYSFQITNRISKYTTILISYRVFYGAFMILLISLGVKDFYWYCVIDLCSDLFGVLVSIPFNRRLYFGKVIKVKNAIRELRANISSGIMLMAANWSAILLTGIARMLIQWNWDELIFGKVSFALSIANLFLTFIAAISVVLFPSLKRIELDKLKDVYVTLENTMSIILVSLLVLYFPGCWILNNWLPVYNQSLLYLGILLPLILYSSKVSLLTNNYFKVLRKEKQMLIINLISVCFAIVLFSASAYILHKIEVLLGGIVVVMMFNSIISSLYIQRFIGVSCLKNFLREVLMTVVFVVSTTQLSLISGFFVYLVALIIFYYINRKTIYGLIHIGRRKTLNS